jgi:hypothetical protein
MQKPFIQIDETVREMTEEEYSAYLEQQKFAQQIGGNNDIEQPA